MTKSLPATMFILTIAFTLISTDESSAQMQLQLPRRPLLQQRNQPQYQQPQYQQPRERPVLKALATGLEIYSTAVKHQSQMELMTQQQNMHNQAFAHQKAQLQMLIKHQQDLARLQQLRNQRAHSQRPPTPYQPHRAQQSRGNGKVDWYAAANAAGPYGRQAASIHKTAKPIVDKIHRATGYKQPKQFDRIADTFGW